MIYSVNGFGPISAISYPALKMGETAVSNVLENLGRRDTESKKFQNLLLQSVKEMAIDVHAIPRYSKLDGMTEFGYKYKSIDSEQVNLITAYDVVKNRPVAMRMFDGSKNDKASVKEMISYKKATYIMPVSSNMTSYQEALKRRRGRMKTFIYRRKEGIHTIKSVVEYRVSSD